MRKFLSSLVKNSITVQLNSRLRSSITLCQRDLHRKSNMGAPVVIGGSNVDIIIKASEKIKSDCRFTYGKITECAGGVSRNIADALTRLHFKPLFISAVGNDMRGKFLLENMKHIGHDGLRMCEESPTATISVIIDANGDCKIIIGNLDIHEEINLKYIKKFEKNILQSSFIIIDGNLNIHALEYLFSIAEINQIPLWFEPTDVSISDKIFELKQWKAITHTSPNFNELKKMASGLTGNDYTTYEPNNLEDLIKKSIELARIIQIKYMMVTLGKYGMVIVTENFVNYYKPLTISHIENDSGAGDCAVAGYIVGQLMNLSENKKIGLSMSCAKQAILSESPVPGEMKLEFDEMIPEVYK